MNAEVLDEEAVCERYGCTRREAIGLMRCVGVFYVGKRKPRTRLDWLEAFVARDIAERAIAPSALGYRDPVCYFIGTDGGADVKIGFTENLPRRLGALQMASGSTLCALAALSGGRDLELALHARFANLRIRGEWFRREGELADLIVRARA